MIQQKNTQKTQLYEQDFHAWTQQQVEFLKNRHWNELDAVNLVEEIDALGRQQRQELRNRLSFLIAHLLKWQFQSQKRSRSWLATIRIQRIDTVDLLEDNPSLRPELQNVLDRAYQKAVAIAVRETNLPSRTFPRECPYTFDEIFDHEFYPGEASDLIDE